MSRFGSCLAGALVQLLVVGAARGADLELAPCEIGGLEGEARCGTYEVFEDRASGAGRRIGLNVVVLPARGEDRRGDPVIFFAGGPGGSTVEMAAGLATFYADELERRDFLLVDYRGSGKSNPLFCPYQEETRRGVAEALESFLPIDLLDECVEALSVRARLDLYTTPNIVDDVAEVARALGYEKVNLSGGSYGSRAVLVFMRRHPGMVRTAILEGVVPTDARMPVTFAGDAQTALEGWLRECAEDEDCRAAFPDPEDDLARILAEVEREPRRLEVIDPESRQSVELVLSRNALVQTLRYMLYDSGGALKVPAFVHAAVEGDWQPLAQTAFSVGGLLMAKTPDGLYLSVTCAEDVATIGPNAAAIQRGFLGDFRLRQQVAACEKWVEGSLPGDFHAPVESEAPVLIVSGERDPVTPARWGYQAQEFLPRSVHVVVPDGAHGWFGLNGVECVDELWAKLLETGSVDGLDVEGCLAAISRPPFLLEIPRQDEIELARDELERFTGTYTAPGGGLQVTVELSEEGLIARFGEESDRLVPIGPLRFKPLGQPPGGFWQFVDEGGRIVSFRLMSGDRVELEMFRE
jgi:pimeloyl-ACP methyl ester carboxylesterase